MEKKDIKLFYRLPAINFKTYLEENINYYDGLVINANILAYQKKSVTQFLIRTQKPYIIDPATFKFNLKKYELMKDGKFQKSIIELSKQYGPTIKKKISQSETLNFNDFEQDPTLVDEITKNVLAFQKSFADQPSPIQKYKKMLGEKEEKVKIPIFLVAPYFFFLNQNDYYYRISKKFAESSLNYKDNFDIYVTILTTKDILYERSFLDSIIDDFKSMNGFLIWIDNFKEDDNSTTDYELILYRKLIENLVEKTKKPVYVMYGSYFSALMTKHGLTGFCTGVRYGESKKYNYATEEIGKVRFYLSSLKKKIPEDDASRFLRLYPNELCSCDFCTKKITDIKSQNPNINDSQLVIKFFENINPKFKISHFMANRFDEMENIQINSISEIKQKIDNDIQKIVNLQPHLVKEGLKKTLDFEHLKKWKNAI